MENLSVRVRVANNNKYHLLTYINLLYLIKNERKMCNKQKKKKNKTNIL